MRRALCDELSAKKRRCRDVLFSALGHLRIIYSFVAHKEEEKSAKIREGPLSKVWMIHRFDNEDLDYSQWHLSTLTELTRPGCETDLSSRALIARPYTLPLFYNEAATRAGHKCFRVSARKTKY